MGKTVKPTKIPLDLVGDCPAGRALERRNRLKQELAEAETDYYEEVRDAFMKAAEGNCVIDKYHIAFNVHLEIPVDWDYDDPGVAAYSDRIYGISSDFTRQTKDSRIGWSYVPVADQVIDRQLTIYSNRDGAAEAIRRAIRQKLPSATIDQMKQEFSDLLREET